MDTRAYNPPATRRETVIDQLHGQQIADNYRWLEDSDSAEVAAWTAEQNAHTRSILDNIPGRAKLAAAMREVLSVAVISAPDVRGERVFYTRRAEGQDQSVLYVRDGMDGAERVLLNPSNGSQQATVALDWWYPSNDGKLLAYGYSDHGDEKSTLYVLDVDSGEQLSEAIPYTRYAAVAWQPNNQGFYYTRYPAPDDVPAGEDDYHQHVFYHRLGDDWHKDVKLFGEGRDMTDQVGVDLSPNGRWLLVSAFVGWTRSELHLRDLTQPNTEFSLMVGGDEAVYLGEMYDDQIFLMTNEGAPNYRIFAVDLTNPQRANWREIIAAREDTRLEGFKVIGGRLVVDELRNVVGSVSVYSLNGERLAEVALPPLGSISGLGGEQKSQNAYIAYESYTTAPTIYRYQLDSGEISVWAQAKLPFDLELEVAQVQYRSKDGTMIPMFIVARKGTSRNSATPTVLSGYGGFDVSRTPVFTRHALPWLQHGGIYAVANLRGGGEFGEEWHRAGKLEKKQNVFDDFIAAAEYLISAGYTSPEHLAIEGRSNGGLLTGAAVTQRPDLFRAVLCGVPLLDMTRYHLYRIARLWIPEYGDPEDPAHFPFIYAYSPYHRVQEGVAYPAVLLYTATSDSRVDPLHARKMAAAMQAANTSNYPILLRVEDEAGHGIGKPLYKQVEEYTDLWGFVFDQLGVAI